MLAKSGYISLLKMQIIEFPSAKHNKNFFGWQPLPVMLS